MHDSQSRTKTSKDEGGKREGEELVPVQDERAGILPESLLTRNLRAQLRGKQFAWTRFITCLACQTCIEIEDDIIVAKLEDIVAFVRWRGTMDGSLVETEDDPQGFRLNDQRPSPRGDGLRDL